MNKEIAERWCAALWCAALESGEIPQTTGVLYRLAPLNINGVVIPAGMCCLGVLTDIYAKEHGIEWNMKPGEVAFFGDSHVVLPSEVREWADMKTTEGTYKKTDGNHLYNLANDNDSGKTFVEIAAIIRKEVDNL